MNGMTETAVVLEAAKAAAERLAGEPIVSISRLGEGANSRVFRVTTRTDTLALKIYPQRPGDNRSRVEVEWKALTFLRANHVNAVPYPLARDKDGGCMLMEWVRGSGVERHTKADIDHAAGFIVQIFSLSTRTQAHEFPPASESCLSRGEILRQVDDRLSRLASLPGIESFLSEELMPALELCRRHLPGEPDVVDVLPEARRRLIPADFGFHNALREANGILRYVDFDYFGWDDPVKLTADFLLHPAMRLSEDDRTAFVGHMRAALPDDSDFPHRLGRHLPLYAIRWALIVLNAFRRDRESELPSSASERDALLTAQVEKAQRFLARGWSSAGQSA